MLPIVKDFDVFKHLPAHLTTAVPAFWIIVSAGSALVGGLVVSLIPAIRAALLHPVEALRQE